MMTERATPYYHWVCNNTMIGGGSPHEFDLDPEPFGKCSSTCWENLYPTAVSELSADPPGNHFGPSGRREDLPDFFPETRSSSDLSLGDQCLYVGSGNGGGISEDMVDRVLSSQGSSPTTRCPGAERTPGNLGPTGVPRCGSGPGPG